MKAKTSISYSNRLDPAIENQTVSSHGAIAEQRSRRMPRVDQWLSYAILTCGFLTVAVGAYLILSSYSLVPAGDEWSEIDAIATVPGHHPPISWLWSQHNEHRVVFYRLLLLADIHLFHGKHWISFWSNLAVQCGFLGLLFWLLRFGRLCPVLWRAVIGLGAFCLFCPTQWENLGGAFQISVLLVGFFFALALLGLLRYESSVRESQTSWPWLALSLLAAAAATFSNGNGVLVWPLSFSIAVAFRLRLRILLAYAASGFVLIGTYLYHYVSPVGRSSPWQSLRQPLAILHFTASYLGVVLPPWMRIRSLVAVSTGGFGLLAALAVTVWVLRHHEWRKPFHMALLGLMFFSVGTAFITALGRMALGPTAAFQSRYQTFNLLFWFSAVTLVLLVVDEMLPQLRTVLLMVITVTIMLAATQFTLCLRAAQLMTRRHEAAALTIVTGIPDKQTLEALITTHPEVPWRDADYLRQEHLFLFSDSRFGQMGRPLTSYHIGSQEFCTGRVDKVEPVTREDSLIDQDTGGFRISGWAVERPSENPVRRLVISADGKIVGLAIGGLQFNISGNKAFLIKAKLSEWRGSVRPPPGTASLDVYAVLDRTDELCHLATVPLVRH